MEHRVKGSGRKAQGIIAASPSRRFTASAWSAEFLVHIHRLYAVCCLLTDGLIPFS
jgi:hypothetical protein